MSSLAWFVKVWVLPPTGPLVLAALAALFWRHRGARMSMWLALLLLWLSCSSAVSDALMHGLYGAWREEQSASSSVKPEAIVVLGGGLRGDANEASGVGLGRLTLERVRHAARLSRHSGLPVLVTGGLRQVDSPSEAELMRQALQDEWGISVRWVEDRALNTYQSAQASAALLRQAGVQQVWLVMHPFDVRRAIADFDRAGIVARPAITLLPTGEGGWMRWVPSAAALENTRYAVYEWLALAAKQLGLQN